MAFFESSVVLNCTHEKVFEFILQPRNVLEISPPEMGLHFVNAPERLELGSQLEFQIQGFGQVQHVIHEIIELESPVRFIEQQIMGPLKSWVHEHLLEPDENGGTRLIDRIEFEPPGGLIGFLVTESRILSSLEEGFDHRHEQMKRLLEQPQ